MEIVLNWQRSITDDPIDSTTAQQPNFVARAVQYARRREYVLLARLKRSEDKCDELQVQLYLLLSTLNKSFLQRSLDETRSTIHSNKMARALLDPVANGLFEVCA